MKGNTEEVTLKLIKYFLRGYYKFTLKADEVEELDWSNQHIFLQSTIHSPTFKKYPLNAEFCRLFFKKLILYLEPHHEIHDDIFKFLCYYMNIEPNDSNFCYHHYIINNDCSNMITIKETNNIVVNGTTGMKTWEAAFILSDWILSNKELCHDKKILELGSGVGFTGIVLAKFCTPKSVTMTDCHPDVLKTISENIDINFPDLQKKGNSFLTSFCSKEKYIDVMSLDWNDIEDAREDETLTPDIVIGADIVYDPSILQSLCNVIAMFFNKNINLQVVIAIVIRNEETFKKFLDELDNKDFVYEKNVPGQSKFLDWDQETKRCILKIKQK